MTAGTFEKHLFISYAHIDNLPLEADQQGWISRFHTALEAMLSMRLGCQAQIWRDAKLSGNDVFGDEILAQFPHTAVMISILSPRYISSDWCTREVREFCATALRTGGVVVQNKSRVIKVVKTPVETEAALPDVIRATLGYPFYIVDEDQTPLELDPAYGPDMAQKYNVKVAKLAFELAQTLKLLGPGAASPVTGAVSRPSIYLAECAYDLRPSREALETELRVLGYPTLPDTELPRDEGAYGNAVTKLLEQCSLSIHLVGASPGVVPDGPSGHSVLWFQNELAIQRSRDAGLRRLIWLPQGVTSRNVDQQSFIDSLQKNPAAQFGADLISADFETFKTTVHAVLKRIEQPEPAKTAATSGNPLVYVVCDKRDREATLPLRKYLKSRSVDTKVPLFEGDAAAVRQAHQDLLAQCSAVLLFYGAADEAWKRSVEADLKKATAFRGAKPLTVYTVLAAPSTTDKTDLVELEEPNLINSLETFSEASLKPFLDVLGVGAQHE